MKSEEEFIKEIKRYKEKGKYFRVFSAIFGILSIIMFFIWISLFKVPEGTKATSYAGFVFGAMFGFVSVLMVLNGIVWFMHVFRIGRQYRAEDLLLKYYKKKDDN
ncbi:MAG: hypothetical protein WCP55_15075 [Lentisphaerota bacterium]